jgi:S1-C subfamily serine protease
MWVMSAVSLPPILTADGPWSNMRIGGYATMTQLENGGRTLAALSDELAAAVERAGNSVVTVDARPRTAASGTVWEGGVVVTADHVIERDDNITVTLPNGTATRATVAGRDPGTDLAVLKLEAAAPTPAATVPLDAVKVGHLVLAVGRPRAGSPMASFGVVSAIGGQWRTARGGTVEGYVRADVSLYPGFSGGPLVDTGGRVIGLNSWYLARGQELAIPAAGVSSIVQVLLREGRVRRAYLGITSQPVRLPEPIRQQLGLTQEVGLMILGVESGSPAERGGILMGDVLVKIGDRIISDPGELRDALGSAAVGQAIGVAVVRGGKQQEISVTPSARE